MRFIKEYRKTLIIAAILIFAALLGYVQKQDVKAGSGDNLSGYAWSENIGWISFNSTNQSAATNYGVKVASNGNLSGYAWSENVGWISFNETTGCPQTPCIPTFNRTSGEVSGWARACAGTTNGDCTGGSRTDGWDGWIHLKGSNYGVAVSSCSWNGYAWGSDIVGWIHFKGSNYGVVGTGDACAAPPPPQPVGSSCSQNSGCQSNICQGGTCVAGSGGACTSNSQCLTGLVCLNGACISPPQCQDNVDNDNDGKIDFPNDPGCTSSSDNEEKDLPQPKFKEVNP